MSLPTANIRLTETQVRIALIAVLSVSVCLRFWDLDRTSLWLDEAASHYQANTDFLTMLYRTAGDNYPPLHNIILWLTIKLFGNEEWTMRAPSALMSVATVYVVYRAGRYIFDDAHGLLGAALLTVMPEHIWHASEARNYALLSLTSIMYIWATVAHFRGDYRHRSILSCLAALSLLLTHVYGTFAFAAGGTTVCLLAWRARQLGDKNFRFWFASQVAAGLLFLPWIYLLALRMSHVVNTGFWIRYPSPDFLWKQLTGTFSPQLLVAFIAILAGAVALHVRRRITGSQLQATDAGDVSDARLLRTPGEVNLFLFAVLAGPLTIAYVFSVVFVPILHTKYLLVSVTAFVLLGAHLMLSLPIPKLARVALGIAVIASVLPSAIHRASFFIGERHDMRGAAAFVESQRQEHEDVTMIPSYFTRLFIYYSGHREEVTYEKLMQSLEAGQDIPSLWIVHADHNPAAGVAALNTLKEFNFQIETNANFHGLAIYRLERKQKSDSSQRLERTRIVGNLPVSRFLPASMNSLDLE